MNFEVTKEMFERIVLSATEATGEVYAQIAPQIPFAQQHIKNVLLGTFADQLATVPGLEMVVTKMVCLYAYAECIPHLDLVLTGSGFGVVRNENVAPASPERVKALLQQVKDSYEDAYDQALEMLVGTPWAETPQAVINVNHFIYTARQFRRYCGVAHAHREQLDKHCVVFTHCENEVERVIGFDTYQQLMDKTRKNSYSREETLLVDFICRYIGCTVGEDMPAARKMLEKIEDYVDKHPQAFAAYVGSDAYQVKNFKRYENKQEDSTFFFS